MKKYSLLFLFLVSFLGTMVAQNRITRVEPPNWWAGMKNPNLQLLIYGNNIGNLKPSIKHKGVKIKKVNTVENSNYLFLDLVLDNNISAGDFKIVFSENGKKVATHKYTLEKRVAGAAQRKGFDNSDVLYLITPDRYVNGDASNDNVKGLVQQMDRSDKGGRHGGDIEGIRKNLDYLGDLGFTAIWLNPVLENNMEKYSYHGYSTTDFYKVDPRFGSNESYKQLSAEAKSKGIKLIMDMIVNHCGTGHWWMNDLPSEDWINQWKDYTQTNHRKTLVQDPYASELDRKIFTDGWFVPTMPDLNQRNPFLGTYLTQNGIWWIEYLDLAGIRMDTYSYPDMDYMTEWNARVFEEFPNFNVVGEEWFHDQTVVSYWQAGKKNANGYTSDLKSLMDFPMQFTVTKALLAEEGWSDGLISIYETLAQDFVYANPNDLVVFPDNHDMSRIFTQLNEDYDLFKNAITFYLTTRGVPQIYYGTEILMTNPGTDDHGIIRSDFPGGWAGDTVNAFTQKGLTDQQKEAQALFKKLLNWRQKKTAIHFGKLKHFIPQDNVYVYFRYDDNQKLMVVLNKNTAPYKLELDRFSEILEGSSSAVDVLSGKNFLLNKSIELSPKTPLILEIK